jgi:hypothetical protein
MEQAWTDEIREGDIVTLRSGGPAMTVLAVHLGRAVSERTDSPLVPIDADLGWFTAAGEYRTGSLPVRVLRRPADAPAKPDPTRVPGPGRLRS